MRATSPAPGVHARNLFHVSAAMWDAWAAYDPDAQGYFLDEKHGAVDVAEARRIAISFAAFGLLKHRYYGIPGIDPASQGLERKLELLCLRPEYTDTSADNPAALGNRIAAAAIAYGEADGALEERGYKDPSYHAVNDPMKTSETGTVMNDPNRWQPIDLPEGASDQGGRPAPAGPQKFVGAQWGRVLPFALPPTDNGTPIDLGAPPRLGDLQTNDEFKAAVIEILRLSSTLDPDASELIDISPASIGDNRLGTNNGEGHALNPTTGQPYVPEMVPMADYRRALAEFWADGPSSETPPGHWNVIANDVSGSPWIGEFRLGGTGPVVDRLEWDVKMYFALNGAEHDAAIAAWGLKRHYDSARPMSVIRYMCGHGQSSDPDLPAYDRLGMPLVPGLIELITDESSAPGERHAGLRRHIGEIAVHTWRGFPDDPSAETSGVGWILGENWVPYQRVSFVTPAFPGYVSGHSTFSRAGAEVLTALTGSEFFPRGLFHQTVSEGSLRHERGPTRDFNLQWATYYDAADTAGISRLYMGIHFRFDDFDGRRIGSQVGKAAWTHAQDYFAGTAD